MPGTGRLRFIEVKGRIAGADTVTVTKNEILYSLNKPDGFILALVEFQGEDRHHVRYVRQPFQREPDFGVTSVNYDFETFLDEYADRSDGGLLLYDGDEVFPLTRRVLAVPWWRVL